jgi:hypothetical protein
MPFMDLGALSLSHKPVSGDHFNVESPSLLAQFDKTRVTADKAALLVNNVFRGPWIAFPVYLRDYTIKLALLRSAQYNALNVTVNEIIIIILLKDLSSRIIKDPIPLLVGECV